MKKSELLLVCLLFPFIMSAQIYRPVDNQGIDGMVTREIDDFTISLPEDCLYSAELSQENNVCWTWMTPEKDFMMVYCYFSFDESFSQEERLIGEAAELGVELTGDGDILNMKIDDQSYLSFSFTNKMAVGVSKFYPDENIGLFVCLLAPKGDDNRDILIPAITSIRRNEHTQQESTTE